MDFLDEYFLRFGFGFLFGLLGKFLLFMLGNLLWGRVRISQEVLNKS